MGKLSDWLQGTRLIRRIPLPLVNVPSEYSEDVPELAALREKDRAEAEKNTPPGSTPEGRSRVPELGIRTLNQLEQTSVIKLSRDYTKANGGNPDNPGDELYLLAKTAYTAVIACVDPDSDPKDPEPFFGRRGDPESGFRELLESAHIGRDALLYLKEQQELLEDEVSPQALRISPEKLWEAAQEVAESNDAGPFFRLRAGMRWKLTRFLAVHWLSSLTPNSPSSSDSETQTSS
jgi:hypothetical protein